MLSRLESRHSLAAAKRQIMEREMDQLTVLKRNHLFNLPLDASQHEGDLHARSFFLLHYHSPPFSVKLISFCPCQKSSFCNGFSACRFSIYDKGMLLVFQSPVECRCAYLEISAPVLAIISHFFLFVLPLCKYLIAFGEFCRKRKYKD